MLYRDEPALNKLIQWLPHRSIFEKKEARVYSLGELLKEKHEDQDESKTKAQAWEKSVEWIQEAIHHLKRELKRCGKKDIHIPKLNRIKKSAALALACLAAVPCESDYLERYKKKMTRHFIVLYRDVFMRNYPVLTEEKAEPLGLKDVDSCNFWEHAKRYYQAATLELRNGGTLENFFDHHDVSNRAEQLHERLEIIRSGALQKYLEKEIQKHLDQKDAFALAVGKKRARRISKPSPAPFDKVVDIFKKPLRD
jgi:hypothetical protein